MKNSLLDCQKKYVLYIRIEGSHVCILNTIQAYYITLQKFRVGNIKKKFNHLFEIEILCNIIHFFTVIFIYLYNLAKLLFY